MNVCPGAKALRQKLGYSETKMNIGHRRAVNREAQARKYAERRRVIDEIKISRGCVDCGYNAHACALQFDHVVGTKSFKISANLMRKWESILVEIAKCVVRCANCHAVKTVKNEESKGHPRK